MERDYSISIIRILSMLAIVACHIFQAKEMQVAFWLNIGVQIFLFMSGFLYGKKKIKNSWLWIKKQFVKILIPYYIYIFIIIIVYIIFARNVLTINNIMAILLGFQLLDIPVGINHLWFIPVILICYLITPLLQKILNGKTKIKRIALILFLICYTEIIVYYNHMDIRLCNIVCYIIGYSISKFSLKEQREKHIVLISIVIMAIIANLIKIFLVIDNYHFIIKSLMKIMLKNSHILLGSAIFILLYNILKNTQIYMKPFIIKCIDIIDHYCFYIYITHHIFILGPFSIINLTQCLLLNIIIIIGCIITSSYILEKLTKLVKKGLEEHEKNYASLWHETRSNKNVPIS